jgi:hypothetical protein
MSDGEPSQTVGIPDFFYELIARIIPGAAVVAICIYGANGDFKAVYSSVGLSVSVLVAGWVIGVTLDLGVFAGWEWLSPERLRKNIAPDLIEYAWIDRKLLPWDRKLVTKARAQIVFFRSMTAICVFTVLICVAMLYFPRWDFLLPALHDHAWSYGTVCFILIWVFGSCWKWQHDELEEWYKEEEKVLSKSSQSGQDFEI